MPVSMTSPPGTTLNSQSFVFETVNCPQTRAINSSEWCVGRGWGRGGGEHGEGTCACVRARRRNAPRKGASADYFCIKLCSIRVTDPACCHAQPASPGEGSGDLSAPRLTGPTEFTRVVSTVFARSRPRTRSLKREGAPLFVDLIGRGGERDFSKAHELKFDLHVLFDSSLV